MALDRRERSGDPQAALLAALMGLQAGIYTAMPCIVVSYDGRKTCELQPALKARVQARDGSYSWQALPLLVDCPVWFPSGGGVLLSFPVRPGDEALCVFSSRCIDSWWQSGGVQVQAEIRMHDLSDGIALVGLSSLPNVPGALSADAAELRSFDGLTAVSVSESGLVSVRAPGDVSVTSGGAITLLAGAASLLLTQAGAASLVAPLGFSINGEPFNNHKHSDVTNGPDISGGVVI